MNDRSELNLKGDETQDSIEVRPFEHGDNEKIMDIDFSLKRVRIYMWRDGKLVKGTEYYDDDDFSIEQKKEIVERLGPHPAGPQGAKCGAFAGEVMVGYLIMYLLSPEEQTWAISHSFVSRKYRRQGIATRLFALAKKKAVDVGVKKICFLSATNESAVDFYLSVGFVPFEKPPEDEHWSGWDGEDIYMEMKL